MTNLNANENKNKQNVIVRFLENHKNTIFLAIMAGIMVSSLAFATPIDPEAKWREVVGLVVPWIGRLGGVIMLIGGVMFGLGFKSDDAEGKSRGLGTMVSGAIVLAVSFASTTFIW